MHGISLGCNAQKSQHASSLKAQRATAVGNFSTLPSPVSTRSTSNILGTWIGDPTTIISPLSKVQDQNKGFLQLVHFGISPRLVSQERWCSLTTKGGDTKQPWLGKNLLQNMVFGSHVLKQVFFWFIGLTGCMPNKSVTQLPEFLLFGCHYLSLFLFFHLTILPAFGVVTRQNINTEMTHIFSVCGFFSFQSFWMLLYFHFSTLLPRQCHLQNISASKTQTKIGTLSPLTRVSRQIHLHACRW